MDKHKIAKLNRKALNHLLVIVLDQPDKNTYVVLSGHDGDVKAEKLIAPQIVTHQDCHWTWDAGMMTIEEMYKPLGNSYVIRHYPHKTIFKLNSFMNGKQPQIKKWMTPSQFKLTIDGLEAKMEALNPMKSTKPYQDLVNKMLKFNQEHPASGISVEQLRELSKLFKKPKELGAE